MIFSLLMMVVFRFPRMSYRAIGALVLEFLAGGQWARSYESETGDWRLMSGGRRGWKQGDALTASAVKDTKSIIQSTHRSKSVRLAPQPIPKS